MSSPFAVFLKNLRLRSSQRQHELAKLLGYEQAYISSIELGCWRAFKIDQVCALNFDQANLGCRLLHRCG